MVGFGDKGFGDQHSRKSSQNSKNFKTMGMNFDPNNFFVAGIGPKTIIGIVVVGILIWLATGFYRVNPGQEGVEIVFGKLSEITDSGLQYNYPYPIGKTLVPEVQKVRRVDIGYRTRSARWGKNVNSDNIQDVPAESLILTSDENIVDTDFTVFWRIKEVDKFLFNIRDPQQTIKVGAESAMREIVGQTKFDNAVTIGREDIETRTRRLLQNMLDSYGAGIEIEQVELQKSDPPSEVIDAFNDVQRARQDRDRLRNEAESYANSVVPKARGNAERIIREAEGYKEKSIKESEGEAARFLNVYKEYTKNPAVVRKRIYMDTLAELYNKVDKILIDPRASNILPYIKLPDADKKRK